MKAVNCDSDNSKTSQLPEWKSKADNHYSAQMASTVMSVY